MDRNELRQACQTAAAAIVAESYVPRYGDVVDAVIRTVLTEVGDHFAERAHAHAEYQREVSTAFSRAAYYVRSLLPSTDSEASE